MKKYEKYKNSGYSWFGEVPSHWEVKDLKHELKFQTGGTPSTKVQKFYDGEYTWITIRDMKGKFVSDSSQQITIEGIIDANIPLTPKGSLLYSFKLSVGQVAFADADIYTNEAIATFHPSSKNNLVFWYYSLPFSVIHNAEENIYGAKLLNQELIKNAALIVPPISEQSQIVSYLNYKTTKIDSFISGSKQQIELLKEQKAAIINCAVTKGINANVKMKPSGVEWIGEIPEHWSVWKMKFLSRIETGDKNTDDAEEDGVYPFFVRSDKVERLSTYSFDGEAILTAGDGVGVAKVFHYANCKMAIHQRVYKISHFKNVLGEYLYHYIKDNFYKEVIKLSAKTTVDSLRMHMLANFPIVFPDKHEQQLILTHITTEISQIEELIDKYQKQIELMQEYRTALISQAVTGKIDVREWQLENQENQSNQVNQANHGSDKRN
jgi:type I restriction enzyme S subunit